MGRRRDLDAHTHRLRHRKAAMETGRYGPVKVSYATLPTMLHQGRNGDRPLRAGKG